MRANSVGKECTEVDRAYVAGLVDGDGAIMASIEPHSEKKFRFRVRIVLKVTQKGRRDLAFLPKLLRCGSVRANRTTHDWITRDQEEILRVLRLLSPYARAKKRQIDIAIKILETPIRSKQDLMHVARLADTLSQFNVRSNNRRKNHVTMIQAHFSSND
jgi:hypothetical protein